MGIRRLTNEEFIKKAQSVHGKIYDYSMVKYKNNKIKVTVICPIHGPFEQTPNSHLKKTGCPKCSFEQKSLSNEDFFERVKSTHGDRYDYSLTKYKNSKSNITIICSKHGQFSQNARTHLRGHNCPECTRHNRFLTREEFVEKAIAKHGKKYDYSLVDYKHSDTKVIIICQHHGSFKQVANDHLRGAGCPRCKSSRGETKIISFFTENKIDFKHQKSFEDCAYTGLLRFDFFLQSLNLLIEYDGEQHFRPIEFWGGKEELKIRQKRDEIKNEWAKENKYRLVRIPYWDFEKIEDILIRTIF